MAETLAPNHYEILRVDRYASAEDVRLAWRRRAQEFHPDKYKGSGDAASLMAQINQAYETLSDIGKRIRYDSALSAQQGRERGAQEVRTAPVARLDSLFGWPVFAAVSVLGLATVVAGFMVFGTSAPQRSPMAAGPAPLQAVSAQNVPLIAAVDDPVMLVATPRIQPRARAAVQVVTVAQADVSDSMLKLVSDTQLRIPPTWRYEQALAR